MRPSRTAGLTLVLLLCGFVHVNRAQASDFTPSEDLAALLEAREDGQPVLSEQQRSYFDALPPRAKQLFEDAIENEILSEAEHLSALLAPGLRPQMMELLMEDNCIVCHADPSLESEVVFSADPDAADALPGMNLPDFASDVHFRRGLSCAGCHRGDPSDVEMSDATYEGMPEAPGRAEDRSWIPGLCARCHADSVFMRPYDPDLPTDQYAKYKESKHGRRLLLEGDSQAAQCVSCHGAHGIRAANSSRSRVHARNVAETCGGCHADAEIMRGRKDEHGESLPTDQLEQYRKSVHGRALLEKGDLGAPTCNDCHGSHAAAPPRASSVAQACRTCHADVGELFDGSKHKVAFDENGWPECGKCHGEHDVQEADDRLLTPQAGGLCHDCHREFAKDNEECERSADYFHASITSLASESDGLHSRIEGLAERGLDTDPLRAKVVELHDILRRARTGIHAFDRGEFEPIEREGQDATLAGRTLVAEAELEYRFRRNGLVASVGVMSVLAVLLWLKIRELEVVQAAPPSADADGASRERKS